MTLSKVEGEEDEAIHCLGGVGEDGEWEEVPAMMLMMVQF